MGTWGFGPLANDWARDWLADVVESNSVSEIIDRVEDAAVRPRLSDQEATVAFAAIELVASAGSPDPKLLPEHLAWLSRAARELSSRELRRRACLAMSNIRSNSELRDGWEAEGELKNWLEAVDSVAQRLRTSAP